MPVSPDIGSLIGKGADAEIFSFGPHVLKLFIDPARKQPAFIEAQNLVLAAAHDLPVPVVHQAGHYQGRWGLVMDRVEGEPLADRVRQSPELLEESLEAMARLHMRLHAATEPRLRPLKPKLADAIHTAPQLDAGLKSRIAERLAALPDGQSICHGDFHPFNLIGPLDRLTIIDWLDTAAGPAAADVCRSAVILSTVSDDLADAYVRRYAALSGISEKDIFDWRPVIAAARLRENTPDQGKLLRMAKEIS